MSNAVYVLSTGAGRPISEDGHLVCGRFVRVRGLHQVIEWDPDHPVRREVGVSSWSAWFADNNRYPPNRLAVVATRVAQLRSPGYFGNPGKPYSWNYRIPSWYSVQPRYIIRLHKLRLLTLRLGAAPAHHSILWGNPHLASTCGICLLHQKPVNCSLE